jgi:hypothetical protein
MTVSPVRALRVFAPVVLAVSAFAQDPAELFRNRVLPVLERDCQGCHGSAMALSNLDLRSREGLLKGGARGPTIVVGDADSSLLIRALEAKGIPQMPPGGADKKVASDVVAAFREWIGAGAPWPEEVEATKWGYQDEDLWAFRPLRPFDSERTVDWFVDAKLRDKGLEAAPRADRRTLIRRVTFDLTGLPPTPSEIDQFERDSSPDAWAKLVDRLLTSPQYGERWGRHWLDVVRYADSSGYSNDFERPNAWRYRDYVIRAFNADKAYDRFVKEQIAGDELYPGDPEAVIATGFLRSGPWEHTAMSVEAVTRQLFLDDVTHATASTFLGLTLGCAKCHDHKFDPIPTRDYYRMVAAFATAEFTRPHVGFLDSENTSRLTENAKFIRTLYDTTKTRMEEYKRALDEAKAAGKETDGEQFETFKLFQKHAQIYKDSLDRFEPKAFAVVSGPSDDFPDGGPTLKYPKRAEYSPSTIHILTGGNLQSPADAVTPGVLSALKRYGGYPEPVISDGVEGRRAALAEWIASEKNPLTARVMVNRIWQYHFGRGIAADTSNFGKMGAKPSHPELLDWLAASFIRSGWSVKSVHRAILLSEAYQRDSRHPSIHTVREMDPENKLLARFEPRRLEAEAIRDSILAVSGELNLEAGGPGVFPQINEDVARQPQHRMGSLAPAYYPSPKRSQRNRRTIYTFQQRSLIDPMVEVFNGPSLDLSCERREASTVPTQAFTLFNSQLAHDMALAFAARLEREAPHTDGRIRRAYRLAFGRDPDAKELQDARDHVARMTTWHQETPTPERAKSKPLKHKITSELTGETFEFTQQEMPVRYEPNLHPSEVSAEIRALADFALVLFNTSEFVYIY